MVPVSDARRIAEVVGVIGHALGAERRRVLHVAGRELGHRVVLRLVVDLGSHHATDVGEHGLVLATVVADVLDVEVEKEPGLETKVINNFILVAFR